MYRTDTSVVKVDRGHRSLSLFVSLAGGMEVRKTYTFHADGYGIDVEYALVAVDGGPTRRALELLGRPEDVRFGWNQGIAHTERNQKMEQTAMRAVARVGDDYVYKRHMKMAKGVEKVQDQRSGSVRFAGLQDRYFTIVGIVPWEQGEPVEGTIRLDGDKETDTQSWSIQVPARRGTGGDIATARSRPLHRPAGGRSAFCLQPGCGKFHGPGLEDLPPPHRRRAVGPEVRAPVHSRTTGSSSSSSRC